VASSALERFQRRLALVAYFRHVFGVGDPRDAEEVGQFYDALKQQPEGYDAEGRSHVSKVLEGLAADSIDPALLRAYDANVRRHTESLNRHRALPITLKYFQVLAALMTECYLHRATDDLDLFLADLNAFVDQQNGREGTGGLEYPAFGQDDLTKLAYWMATGSGKTLLMHLNYYQYLHYCMHRLDSILLVTTGEGMSEQHMAEMEKSGIPCRHFSASTGNLFGADPHCVKVIEIHKLVEEKSGGGESVEVSSFEGRNLVFVDEGHKGTGSEAQAWRSRREALAREGFTFEYSATFGQAVAGAGADVEDEYSKAILFDYSYPRFYEAGYGKDYRILNLEQDLDPDLTSTYLLADLLTFYEQVRAYAEDKESFYQQYNVAPPLLVFIGHSVTAGKPRSQLSSTDRRSLADVQEIVLFLHRVLQNEGNWVPQVLDAVLEGRTALRRGDGADLFEDAFRTLRSADLDGEAVYADMLRRVFHVAAPGAVHLVDIKSAQGEIGLRAGAADRFFGVINIGDASNFMHLVEQRLPEIALEEDQFATSLFREINQRESPVNVLIGSKKFIEGWDSWRVSTMGLMNIGRGEGPQIIQLFGRGVRLLGKDRSLQRSSAFDDGGPANLPLLETLSIFGVRARYMAEFRRYLSKEGIDTDERELIVLPTRPGADFLGRGLLVMRPKIEAEFEDSVLLELAADPTRKPVVDLMPVSEILTSDGLVHESAEEAAPATVRHLPQEILPLLDWNRLYREVWAFRTARAYINLAVPLDQLKAVLDSRCYELRCPEEMLTVDSFADVLRLEQIALMILRKYVERFFTHARRHWEQEQMVYRALDEGDGNLIGAYQAHVRRSATSFLKALRAMLDDPARYETEAGLPERVHFDRHLYLPLLVDYTGQDPPVKYSPRGLNAGERLFAQQLRAYLASADGQSLLERHDRELFLLRNQSRGTGVGFLVNDEHYFPDFILWLVSPEQQDIVFVDPHGLISGSNLSANNKVQFYRGIKEYEAVLNKRDSRKDVTLHSYIVSRTSISKMRQATGLTRLHDFNSLNVYFEEQDANPAAKLILRDVLEP
jgi:hypothetical protein